MSEEKVENKLRGKVVLEGSIICEVFNKMHFNNSLPEGKVMISCIKNSKSEEDKIIIDLDEKKFIFSDCFYDCKKHSSHIIYLNHIYDLEKIDLNKFFEKFIAEPVKKELRESFRNNIKRIIENDYLREKLCEMLEKSPHLKHSLKRKIKNYCSDLAMKLLIWSRKNI